ncbi:Arm DNA-binding domain-containing protein [Labrys miyagiensis]
MTGLSVRGQHADSGGLYLVVDHNGAKRSPLVFRWQGKLEEMGPGGLPAVSPAKARGTAKEAHPSRRRYQPD